MFGLPAAAGGEDNVICILLPFRPAASPTVHCIRQPSRHTLRMQMFGIFPRSESVWIVDWIAGKLFYISITDTGEFSAGNVRSGWLYYYTTTGLNEISQYFTIDAERQKVPTPFWMCQLGTFTQ